MLVDYLWPEPEPGDCLAPDQPEIEIGDTVSFDVYGGRQFGYSIFLGTMTGTVVSASDKFSETYFGVHFLHTYLSQWSFSWLPQGDLTLINKNAAI